MLNDMISGYINASLNTDVDGSDDPLIDNYDADDIDTETLAAIKRDCALFKELNSDDFIVNDSSMGEEFYAARNSSSAGFGDGDWPESAGTRLLDSATKFGEFHLYEWQDGKLRSTEEGSDVQDFIDLYIQKHLDTDADGAGVLSDTYAAEDLHADTLARISIAAAGFYTQYSSMISQVPSLAATALYNSRNDAGTGFEETDNWGDNSTALDAAATALGAYQLYAWLDASVRDTEEV